MARHLTGVERVPVAGPVRVMAQWQDPEPTATQNEPLTKRNSTQTGEAEALAQERRRTDALALEIAAARRELELTRQHAAITLREVAENAKMHVAKLSKAHVEEMQRAEALARDLAAARQQLEVARAHILALQEGQQKAVADALQEKQKKSAHLTRSLAAARRELKAAKQQGVTATKQLSEVGHTEPDEQTNALAPKVPAPRATAEVITRQRVQARQGATETNQDVRAAESHRVGTTLGTSAVTLQPQPIPRQFEWE
jgi:hypothetical protein